MPLLVPRIRKENQHFIERLLGQLVSEHLHRVVTRDAHVGQLRGLCGEHQAADTGAMNLYAEIVPLGVSGCQRGEVVAVAKADFHNVRCASTEQHVEIEHLRAVELDAVLRPGVFESALLGFGDAAGARDKRANRSGVFHARSLEEVAERKGVRSATCHRTCRWRRVSRAASERQESTHVIVLRLVLGADLGLRRDL